MTNARHATARSLLGALRPGGLHPTVGLAKVLGLLVVPAAVVATGVGVAGASYSSFTSATSSPTNSWAAGSVSLTNDSAGAALFSTTSNPVLKPGSTASHCITVTSTGSLPAVVKLYATGYTNTNGLGSWINLTVVEGTGGSFGSCTGFTPLTTGSVVSPSGTLAAFSANSNYGNGLAVWTTAGVASGSESRTFQFTYTVDPAAPNSAQNGTAAAAFTWEAQNS